MTITALLLTALSLTSLSESAVVPHVKPNGTYHLPTHFTCGSGVFKLPVTKVKKVTRSAEKGRRQSAAALGNLVLGLLYLIDSK
jgi:hypothetical protein